MPETNVGSNVLFISHSAGDRAFAVALQEAIYELLDSKTLIDVRYSTSDKAGPQGGEQWREWIYSQVVEARTALIVVTPHAMGKHWLLWEAGACWGATLAQKAAGASTSDAAHAPEIGALGRRLNVSIAYGLTENECPDPLRGEQIVLGTNAQRMKDLLQRVLRAHDLIGDYGVEVGERMQEVLAGYLKKVKAALLKAPSLITEANVQDWLSRLEELLRSDRLSELQGFQRWMALAFGRDGEAADVPIDVRLHRRLGELYKMRKEYVLAAEQLTLARRAAPRDIYILRPLAEVSMKRLLDQPASQAQAASEEIESLLEAMTDLDDQAFVSNADAAALRGKYLRRVRQDPEQAIETYKAALRRSSDSYYLADVLAQTELELGRNDDAKASFREALGIVNRLGENSVWSHATAATACLALLDPDGARQHLLAIAALGPLSISDRDTICGGFREVASRLGITQTLADDLLLAIADKGPVK